MNFLAHIYLSDNKPHLQIGNFIGDSVKGNDYEDYPEKIKAGIILHRAIDTYTDNHLIVRACKKSFSDYGHYAGVITDILFDHFLAKNWDTYHHIPLEEFTLYFYNLLDEQFKILPNRVQNFYPIMTRENWLLKYETIAGISDILYQMNIRTKNRSQMNYAVIELRENYAYLETQFGLFFNDLERYVMTEIEKYST